MNKRAIILDFTSLLDVIMIILFFFILFSHFETEEAKLSMQTAQQSAEEREKEAGALLDEADGLLEQAKEKSELAEVKLKEAESAKERSGANAAAITEFGSGRSIQIKLRMTDGERDWSLDIFREEEKITEIQKSDTASMTEEFLDALAGMDCETDDTLLCTFVYNASESGTNSAFRDVSEIFGEVKKQYRHFFYSETNMSVFGEG